MSTKSTKSADYHPRLEPFARKNTKILYVSIPINGKNHQRSTGHSDMHLARTRAQEMYREMLDKHTSNISGQIITLEEACDNFLKLLDSDDPADDLKAGSKSMYRTATRRLQGWKTHGSIRHNVTPLAASDANLNTITQIDVDNFLKSTKADYGSHDTYQAFCGRFNRILKWWLSDQTPADENEAKKHKGTYKVKYSVKALKIPTHKTMSASKPTQKLFKPAKRRVHVFEDYQIDGILDYLYKSKNRGNYCYFLALNNLPIRVDECARLQWHNIDYERKRVWIERDKGSTDGHADLPDHLITALKQQQDDTKHLNSNYVWPSKNSNTGYRSVKNHCWLERAMKSLPEHPNSPDNLEKRNGEKLVLHSCRHTLASKLIQTMETVEVQEYFGWSSVQMAERYIHFKSNKVAAKAVKFLNFLEDQKKLNKI